MVNDLPGATGLLLGHNEMKDCDIDVVCSPLAAKRYRVANPAKTHIVFFHEDQHGDIHHDAVESIDKPPTCALKERMKAMEASPDADVLTTETTAPDHLSSPSSSSIKQMLMAADIDVTAVLAGDCDLPADFQEANLFNLYQDHVEHEQLQILQDISSFLIIMAVVMLMFGSMVFIWKMDRTHADIAFKPTWEVAHEISLAANQTQEADFDMHPFKTAFETLMTMYRILLGETHRYWFHDPFELSIYVCYEARRSRQCLAR